MSTYIKSIRHQLGESQSEFAQGIKATVMSVSQWERGVRKVSPDFAVRIAQYATYKGVPTTTDDIYRMSKKTQKTKKKPTKRG